MTTGMDTGWLHVGFGNKGSEFSYFKTWLVREAQIRDRGYVTGGRYKGYVTQRLERGPRQPPFAAHAHKFVKAPPAQIQKFSLIYKVFVVFSRFLIRVVYKIIRKCNKN